MTVIIFAAVRAWPNCREAGMPTKIDDLVMTAMKSEIIPSAIKNPAPIPTARERTTRKS